MSKRYIAYGAAGIGLRVEIDDRDRALAVEKMIDEINEMTDGELRDELLADIRVDEIEVQYDDG